MLLGSLQIRQGHPRARAVLAPALLVAPGLAAQVMAPKGLRARAPPVGPPRRLHQAPVWVRQRLAQSALPEITAPELPRRPLHAHAELVISALLGRLMRHCLAYHAPRAHTAPGALQCLFFVRLGPVVQETPGNRLYANAVRDTSLPLLGRHRALVLEGIACSVVLATAAQVGQRSKLRVRAALTTHPRRSLRARARAFPVPA